MIVRHEDIRALGFCNRGARAFFKEKGLDWRAFVEEGIDSEILEKLDDAMAAAAVDQAKKRLGVKNGRQ